MLRDDQNYEDVVSTAGQAELYMEVVLRNNISKYVGYVRDLRRRNLVSWRFSARERVGSFCYQKTGR